MLLQPCANTYECMLAEIADDAHPEHYGTYMPEQEYLGRFYGTGSVWRHISCRYNFEVDKRERVPHDHTEEHERLLLSTPDEIVVLHYSGLGCKPWDLLLAVPGDFSSLAVASSAGLRSWAEKLQAQQAPDNGQMTGYVDSDRIYRAMLEWLLHLVYCGEELQKKGLDIMAVVKEEVTRVAAREKPARPTSWSGTSSNGPK